MLEFLLLLTLFVRPMYSGLLLVLNMGTGKLPLSIVYIIVAVIDYIYLFTRHLFRYKVKEKLWVAGIVMATSLVLQVVTGLKYDGMEGDYLSSVLSFASLSVPAFFMGYVFVQKNDFRMFGKILPVFIFIISAVVIYADFSTVNSWDGLLHSKIYYNVDYQNCTYYASYALGLTFFYLLFGNELKVGAYRKNFLWFYTLLLPIQLFVILTAGGRGGFLLGVFLAVYFLLITILKYQRIPAYYIVVLAVLGVVLAGLFVYLSQNGEAIRGFSRIASFLENPEDNSRDSLYGKAIEYFLKKPIMGNGIGSVWFTVGYYSHDIFCDLLCETGIVGTGAFVAVLIWYGTKTIKMIKQNSAHQFGLLIFFFVFIMLLFSGYYLTEPMLWFALAYTLFADTKAKETDAIIVS